MAAVPPPMECPASTTIVHEDGNISEESSITVSMAAVPPPMECPASTTIVHKDYTIATVVLYKDGTTGV
jgi:hypothetical protein